MTCPMCGSEQLRTAFSYASPPPGETDFGFEPYAREYLSCGSCGHYVSVTDMDLSRIYEGDYVDATYADDALERTFDRIMSLPPERSDNAQRVARLRALLQPGTVLDVGSGLGVFPARMQEAGWQPTALDPDPRAVAFTRERIGVDCVQADFLEADQLGTFDLVTFNKVLEHVPDPVAMLARAKHNLAPGGAVYIELPDAEEAARDPDGPGREEFFIEHLHVFSMASTCLLAMRAGLTVRLVERVREPSGKYTLRALLR